MGHVGRPINESGLDLLDSGPGTRPSRTQIVMVTAVGHPFILPKNL